MRSVAEVMTMPLAGLTPETPAVSLAALPMRQEATVTEVGGARGFRRRLMELGLVPGTRVRLMNVAPLGDPLELDVRGCRLSIRKNEAEVVRVRP